MPPRRAGGRANRSRLENLDARMGSVVRADLAEGLTTFRRSASLGKLASALDTGDFRKVMRTLPWKSLPAALGKTADNIHEAARRGADMAVKVLPQQARRELRYNGSNPNIQNFVATRTGNLITTVQEGTLQAVKQAVQRSLSKALPPSQLAKEIRGSIGLNARQATALDRYRATLEADATHSPAGIDALTEGYADRLLDQRAIMIARTEVRAASNYGQLEVWKDAQEQELLPPTAQKVWVVDGAPCELCAPMDGVAVGLDETWTLGNGEEVMTPSDSHPNCLCLATIDF